MPPWLHVSVGKELVGVSTPDAFERYVAGETSIDGPTAFESAYDLVVEEDTPQFRGRAVRRMPDPQIILDAVVTELSVPGTQICSRRRGPVERMGRQIVARCATSLGITGSSVARTLGVSQQAVSVMQSREELPPERSVRERVLQRIAEQTGRGLAPGTNL